MLGSQGMHMSLKVLECCHLCATLCAHLVESYCQLGFTASPGPRPQALWGLDRSHGTVPWDESLISRGQKHTCIISGNGEFASSRAAAKVAHNDSHRRRGQLHHAQACLLSGLQRDQAAVQGILAAATPAWQAANDCGR
jgi:hypothetical protein